MNNVSHQKTSSTGLIPGIIACVLAVLGILFLGIIFVPLAFIVAIIGTILAIKSMNLAGIGVNILAWVLIIIGFFTSPFLLSLFVGSSLVASGMH